MARYLSKSHGPKIGSMTAEQSESIFATETWSRSFCLMEAPEAAAPAVVYRKAHLPSARTGPPCRSRSEAYGRRNHGGV